VVPLLGGEALALDLPGHGSAPMVPDASPAGLARAIAAELESRGISRPHVAGNSLGGWVALELGLSGFAASVTAVAPAGLWREPLLPKRSPARALARLALPVLGPLMQSADARRFALAANAAHPERIPPDAARRLVRAYATAPGFEAVNDAMRASRFSRLADVRVPVTLAWPEHDRVVARLRHPPPNVRTVVLPGAGHLPMWDDPERVAELLLSA
jgi:pimeloyl-ACP methyl ester carboxylesterase